MKKFLPPRPWAESDGCTGVKDFLYFEDCKRHDWRYRRAQFARWGDFRARLWSDWRLMVEMFESNSASAPMGFRAVLHHLRWWVFPIVRFIGVRTIGWIFWTPIKERLKK